MNKLINILKSNWGNITFFCLNVFIVFNNFQWGKYVIGNDNYSPELNPLLSLQRSLFSPGWRDYRAWGLPSDSEQADVFRSLYFYILESLGFSNEFISQFYVFFALICGAFFAGLIAKYIYENYLNKDNENSIFLSEYTFLTASLAYLFSLQTLGVFYFKTNIFVALYGFSTPVIYFTIRLIADRFRIKDLILGIFFFSLLLTSALNMTLFISFFILWTFFLLIGYIFGKTNQSKKPLKLRITLLLVGLFISTSFITFPFLYYLTNNADDISNSYINRMITYGQIRSEESQNTLTNTIQYKFGWMNQQFESNESDTIPFQTHYNQPLVIFVMFLIHLATILTSVYGLISKKIVLALLGLLYLIGLFFISGHNYEITRHLQVFLFSNVPYLEQAIRWSSSKFWLYLLLSSSILFAVGQSLILRLLICRFGEKDRLEKYYTDPLLLLTFLIISPISLIIIGIPIIKGDLIFPRYYVSLPVEYIQLKDFIKREGISDERIFYLPESKVYYFREYNWSGNREENFDYINSHGFLGSDFINYLIPNPLISSSLVIGSDTNENNYNTLVESLHTNDREVFCNTISRYEVDLILLDNSQIGHSWDYDYDYDLYNNLTQENAYLEKIWQEGSLSLYKPECPTIQNYTALYSGHSNNLLSRQIAIQNNQINYFTDDGKDHGVIFPLSLDSDRIKHYEDRIIIEHTYEGQNDTFNLDISDIDLEKLPTRIEIKQREIVLSPALPEITIKNNKLSIPIPEYTLDKNESVSAIRLGEQIFDVREKANITVNVAFSEVKDLGIEYYTSIVDTSDLLPKIDGNEIVYCESASVNCTAKLNKDGYIELESRISLLGLSTNQTLQGTSNFNDIDLGIMSTGSNEFILCIYSPTKDKCLNPNNKYLLVPGYNKITQSIEESYSDDNLTIFLNWRSVDNNQNILEIREFVLNTFNRSDSQKADLVYISEDTKEGNVDIRIDTGDLISISIPLIRGNTSTEINASSGYNNIDIYSLNSECVANKIKVQSNILEVRDSNCSVHLTSTFHTSSQDRIAMVFFDHEKYSKTPIDYNIKPNIDDSPQREVYRQRSPLPIFVNGLEYFLFPHTKDTLEFELKLSINSNLLPEQNQNARIGGLYFQFIPNGWTELSLKPVRSESLVQQNLYHTGKHNDGGWVDVYNLKRNKQALNTWELPTQNNARIHLADVLGYIGYFLVSLSAYYLSFYFLVKCTQREQLFEN